MQRPSVPLRASNVFFYYADLDRAAVFYGQTLGFKLVADYGKAKIFQIASTSYITLVDNAIGMHSSEESKTVTLASVVSDVQGWYDYLQGQEVPIHKELAFQPGRAYDGFVALDPEGYYLEFVHFNDHADNARLLPRLNTLPPTQSSPPQSDVSDGHSRPAALTISATILWLYYQEKAATHEFMTETLGLATVYEQPLATIYAASPSGFLGAVVAGEGLHPYSEQKAVTISLLTDEIENWLKWIPTRTDARLRTGEIAVRERYHALVAYTPENYYLEFNTFLEHPDNVEFTRALYPQAT